MEKIYKKVRNAYDFVWKHYELFIIIPISLVLLSAGILGMNYHKSGWFLKRGIDFTGGTEITLSVKDSEIPKAKEIFGEIAGKKVILRTLSSGEKKWVSFSTSLVLKQEDVEKRLKENGLKYSDLSIRSFGATVSSSFFKQALFALLIAFVLMSIVIFLAFRSLVPSGAAILSVIVDVVITMGLMSLFNIELTLGSLAALLMIIGYSVDTDVLLSTRVLKNKALELKERVLGAAKTGLTMSLTSLMAFLVLFLVSTSPALDTIAIVIVFGLLADIPSTWLQNTVILKSYVERIEQGKRGGK